MKFSFLIPAYNSEKYISNCIHSILKQSCPDWECVIVDDGSTDGTGKLIDEFAAGDSRIKTLHKENEGVALARNAGSDLCTGDYILCVDSDDCIDKDLLKIVSEKMGGENSIDMICFGYKKIMGQSEETVVDAFQEGFYEEEKLNEIRNNFLFDERNREDNEGAMSYSMCTKLIRRDFFIRNKDLAAKRIRLGEDMLFVLRALMESRRILVLHDALYYYNLGIESSATHNYRKGDIANGYSVLQELMEMAGHNTCYLRQACHFIINYLWNQYIFCALRTQQYKEFRQEIGEETDKGLLFRTKAIHFNARHRMFDLKRSLISNNRLLIIYCFYKLKYCWMK